MNLGDLNEYIATQKPVSFRQKIDWCLQISQVFDYLHTRYPPIIHSDLKSPNILLTKMPRGKIVAKVADLGLSRTLGFSKNLSRVVSLDNAIWCAPELLLKEDFSVKVDVYSFSTIMWELLMWSMPFQNITFMFQIEDLIKSGKRPEIPSAIRSKSRYKVYIKLMQRCWDRNPTKRPSFAQITQILTEEKNRYLKKRKKQSRHSQSKS
mmetsp:Transcript_18878/g.28114  ORF Transcript_18878/g.28114 Transcript_18878/m.28114 type:complete len:208 (-) Transcript_18878:22-645(-)